jgi:hypothetical protein
MTVYYTMSSSSIDDAFDEKPDYSENEKRDAKDIKKAIRISQEDVGMHVVAIAQNMAVPDLNLLLEVPTIDGDPLNSEVYDTVKDCYHVRGVSSYDIGRIPVNYVISLDDGNWEQEIPLPFSVIKRYMTEDQRKSFEEWRSKYKSSDFSIVYLQMLGVF